ncbi:MAG: phytanoyl-CoA dioxygenase family protein [Vampirovibrio sp.]|nr:phytanoyl-CoA dioxygenase family protein [Vampirovibrio sp.]
MTVKDLRRNIKDTTKTAAKDLLDAGRQLIADTAQDLSTQEKETLSSLNQDGFVVIPSYWDRQKALNMGKKLQAYLSPEEDRDLPNGAYLRVGNAKHQYGQGIRRIYCVDGLLNELADFRYDPFPLKMAQAFYGRPFYSGLLLYQHNMAGNIDGGYHVDGYKKEFKSFLYLDDVDDTNGPFTYIRGSHKRHGTRMKRQLQGLKDGSSTGLSRDDLKHLLHNEVQLTGKAGTLILADVRGFHYGSPQKTNARSVLVNYIIQEPKDLLLDK